MAKYWLSATCSLLVALVLSLEASGEKRMVCYYGAWAVYRPGLGKFVVEDIDPKMCTHLVYGFAKLEDNAIASFDPWEDLKDNWGKGGYLRFSGLKKKNPKLKTLLAIGGWNEGSTKYSEMASSPESRKTFVESIQPFLDKYNFDGLDLDWEYPTTRGGKPEDKENFSLLVQELRAALGSRYLLTAAVSPNIETLPQAYDVPVLAENLDFISVMCYDYHGAWEGHPYTGHNTPLYRAPRDEKYIPHFNVNDTVHHWLDAGLPAAKMNMGMALYGRGFTLDDPSKRGLYAPAKDGIKMGPYTRQDGTWGYNEICEVYKKEMNDWKIVMDDHIQAPYAYKDSMWIGYDDVDSLYTKSVYARNLDIGGAMVWSIETDDFRGHCHGKKYILIHTIVAAMNGGNRPTPPQRPQVVEADPDDSDDPEEPTTTPPTSTTRRRKRTRSTTTTTTEDPDYYDDETTTAPPRRTRPPRVTTATTTTAAPVPETEGTQGTKRTRPPRRTTPPSSGVHEEEVEEVTSPSSPDGECTEEGIIPNGNDCSTFIICQNQGDETFRKHLQNCAYGLAFDPTILSCNFPDKVPHCNKDSLVATFYRKNSA